MKTSVNFSSFCDEFLAAGRSDQFSYPAKRALFDYLEEYEDACGVEIELDVIALCCEYEELDVLSIINQYNIEIEDGSDEDETMEQVVEWLQDNTQYIGEGDSGQLVYCSSF